MIEEGLRYPIKGDRGLGRVFIGGLLGVLSFLIIPGLALLGYLVWVLAAAARESSDPPEFDDWGAMIVDGLRALVVGIAYGIVPAVLIAVSVGFTAAGVASEGSVRGVLGGVGALGLLVSLVALVVVYYLLPAALTNMALSDRLGAAFAFGTITDALLSAEYFIAWLVPFAIGIVANIAVFLFVVLTFGIGLLVVVVVGPFVQFYVQMAVFYMFGRAFGRAIGLEGDGLADPTVV